jgi:putative NIF3 family GTP cyclohydrolase 1 type 2
MSSIRWTRCMLVITVLACFEGLCSAGSAQTMTAGEAWAHIQKFYGGPPPQNTVDTLKGGTPSTVVTGIATTFLDTMDVLREAVRRNDNLIITHEPTFYNHMDDTSNFVGDPVYEEKRAFIEQHHLIVYRLHDENHADPRGDQILAAFYETMGWDRYPHPSGANFVTIPRTTLSQLALELKTRLHAETLRLEGDPNLEVTEVAVLPGAAGLAKQVSALRQSGVQVLIAGEASEWETVEYVRDAAAQGRSKALVLLGHEVSEEPGMESCARDLRGLFPGVRVDHIPARQPLGFIEMKQKAGDSAPHGEMK